MNLGLLQYWVIWSLFATSFGGSCWPNSITQVFGAGAFLKLETLSSLLHCQWCKYTFGHIINWTVTPPSQRRPAHCPGPAPWQQAWKGTVGLESRPSSPMRPATTAPCSASLRTTSSPCWCQRPGTAGTTGRTRRPGCKSTSWFLSDSVFYVGSFMIYFVFFLSILKAGLVPILLHPSDHRWRSWLHEAAPSTKVCLLMVLFWGWFGFVIWGVGLSWAMWGQNVLLYFEFSRFFWSWKFSSWNYGCEVRDIHSIWCVIYCAQPPWEKQQHRKPPGERRHARLRARLRHPLPYGRAQHCHAAQTAAPLQHGRARIPAGTKSTVSISDQDPPRCGEDALRVSLSRGEEPCFEGDVSSSALLGSHQPH